MAKTLLIRSAGLFLPGLLLIVSCKKDPIPLAPPTVEYLAPVFVAGDIFTRTVDIQVKATAVSGRTIERVEFYVDGILQIGKADYAPPYTSQLEATDKFGETRQIEARAYDSEGQSGSAFIDIKFWNGVEKKAMPTSRYCFTSETVGGKIYVIGGYEEYQKVEAYDPATDTWETKASTINGHACHASCVIDGKIYVFGGDAGFNLIPNSEVYDPATDTWTEIAPIPMDDSVALSLMGAAAFGGKAYLFGGQSTSPGFVQVGEYDPATNSWSTKSFKNIFSPAAAALNGKLYVAGGCMSPAVGGCADPTKTLETYDPVTGVFTPQASMVYQHSGHVLLPVNGKLYAIGGVPNDNNRQMEVYDPATNSWRALPDMPRGFINFGGGVVNGKIYIIDAEKVYEYNPG